MLLAVEGGGFFSSSASGYSKGLTLLLLGQRQDDDEDKSSMRVAPWNHHHHHHHHHHHQHQQHHQYQLVDQEPDPDPHFLQLATFKNRLFSRGCICFGRPSSAATAAAGGRGLDSPFPLKVGPAHSEDLLPDGTKDPCVETGDDGTNNGGSRVYGRPRVGLKSSLKKPNSVQKVSVVVVEDDANNRRCNDASSGENGSDIPGHTERRKVQWTDICGNELAEIREFEPSETAGSDDEFENGNERSCSCAIM